MLKSEYDLSQVAEVIEVKDWKNANLYLNCGWILLHTHTWDHGDPVARHQKTVYAVGWPRSMGEAVHPKIEESARNIQPLKEDETGRRWFWS